MPNSFFLVLLMACSIAPAAWGAPDEEILGKDAGYPVQRFGSSFSMFKEEFKVGTFSHMDKVLWPRNVKGAGTPSSLPMGDPLPPISYPYGNKTFSLDDFLSRQRITGLLIPESVTSRA
jgi:hypothetical protein